MNETPRTYRKRSIVIALVALSVWAAFSFLLPIASASAGSDVTLLGLPLHTALATLVALPVIVLTMFWHAGRQNADDVRFGEDD
jgi:putative solute:sodium symporter small subunit